MEPLIDPEKLGTRLRERRLGRRLAVREAAKEAGVSPATFSRAERGHTVPETPNLLRLMRWAGARVEDLHPGPTVRRRPVHADEPASTPEAVSLHLRADPNLAPEDAAILAEIFRSAYQALVDRKKKS